MLAKTLADSNDTELTVTTAIKDTDTDVRATLDALHNAKLKVQSMAVHKPTLDDVFLSLTGKTKKEKK